MINCNKHENDNEKLITQTWDRCRPRHNNAKYNLWRLGNVYM